MLTRLILWLSRKVIARGKTPLDRAHIAAVLMLDIALLLDTVGTMSVMSGLATRLLIIVKGHNEAAARDAYEMIGRQAGIGIERPAVTSPMPSTFVTPPGWDARN